MSHDKSEKEAGNHRKLSCRQNDKWKGNKRELHSTTHYYITAAGAVATTTTTITVVAIKWHKMNAMCKPNVRDGKMANNAIRG